jgi:pilus assembly protein TadC
VFPLQAWLPGGGRGALFVIVHAALLLLAFEVWSRLSVMGQFEWEGYRFRSLLGAIMNLFVFLLLPSALLSRFTATSGGRVISRALVALFLAGINLAPLFMSFILQRPELGDWAPLVAAFKQSRAPYIDAPYRFLCAIAVLAVVANVPRLLASMREVSAIPTRRPDTADNHAASVV